MQQRASQRAVDVPAQLAHHSREELGSLLQAILDSADEIVVAADESQRIVIFNPAAERAFGYRARDVIGLPLSNLLPERFRDHHFGLVQTFGGEAHALRQMAGGRVVPARRANGEEFSFHASIIGVKSNGGFLLAAIGRDLITAGIESRLRRNSLALQTLRENDRSRIAREVHESLGQMLAAMHLDLLWLEQRPNDNQVPERIRSVRALLERAVEQTRRVAADLRPLMLDDLGLVPTLEWLAAEAPRRYGFKAVIGGDLAKLQVDAATSTAIFRIVEDALGFFALAQQVDEVATQISLDHGEVRIALSAPAARWIAAEDAHQAPPLVAIQERAYWLNGRTLLTLDPEGVALTVTLPLVQAGTELPAEVPPFSS